MGKNVQVVSEGDLYGLDPRYTTIFNNIAGHELVRYTRGRAKDCGEVYSLAYAAYHKMNYFCSKEIMVDHVAQELEDLKSMYKKYCVDVIKRHGLPSTLSEYIRASQEYL